MYWIKPRSRDVVTLQTLLAALVHRPLGVREESVAMSGTLLVVSPETSPGCRRVPAAGHAPLITVGGMVPVVMSGKSLRVCEKIDSGKFRPVISLRLFTVKVLNWGFFHKLYVPLDPKIHVASIAPSSPVRSFSYELPYFPKLRPSISYCC